MNTRITLGTLELFYIITNFLLYCLTETSSSYDPIIFLGKNLISASPPLECLRQLLIECGWTEPRPSLYANGDMWLMVIITKWIERVPSRAVKREVEVYELGPQGTTPERSKILHAHY